MDLDDIAIADIAGQDLDHAPESKHKNGIVEPDDVVIADIAGHALDIVLHGPGSAHKNGILKRVTHTSIPIHPCTILKPTIKKKSTHQT